MSWNREAYRGVVWGEFGRLGGERIRFIFFRFCGIINLGY